MLDVVAGLLAVAEDVVSPGAEYPEVTLYHGSYLVNLDSILSNGIVPRVIDAEATVAKAIDDVSDMLGFDAGKRRELDSLVASYSLDRVKQSKFDKVYLSGERGFAESNAKAGGEWYEEIVSSALRMVHEDYYDLVGEYAGRIADLEKAMKKQDAELRSTPMEDGEGRRELLRSSRELERQRSEVQKEKEAVLGGRRQEIDRQNKEILRKRFGDEAVIFTVAMPYSVFARKMASSHSRERIRLFEEMYAGYLRGEKRNWFDYIKGDRSKVWEFFQEVHLSGVESGFIKKWEVMR